VIRRYRQEKILGSTLSETLILFLFILLAISSIYNTKYLKAEEELAQAEEKLRILAREKLPSGKGIFDSTKVVSDNEEVINKKDLIALRHELQDLKKEIKSSDKHDQIKKRDKKIRELEEKLIKMQLSGVSAPPCVLKDNNVTLFKISFFPDTMYSMTFENLIKPITVSSWTLKNGKTLKLNHREFNLFASLMVEGKRINQDDDFCCCKPSHKSSAYCLECIYAYERNEQTFDKPRKWSLKKENLVVSTALGLFMLDNVNKSFYKKH
jgi:hypothetical protein